jgi:hypothetical protein
MRMFLITLSMTALVVAAWLVIRVPRGAEPVAEQIQGHAAPAVPATLEPLSASFAPKPEGDSGTDDDSTSAAAETPSERERWTPYLEPEFRDALRGYLIESGLSPIDSERVAAAASERLHECVVTVGLEPANAEALEVCNSNVAQQTGLDGPLIGMAFAKARSERSRRRRRKPRPRLRRHSYAPAAARTSALTASLSRAPRSTAASSASRSPPTDRRRA